jgi:hypothetical protein
VASGDQLGSRAGSGLTVTCRTLVPSSNITQTSLRLPNAIRRPSGENAGSAGWPGALSRRALPPPCEASMIVPVVALARPS